MASSISVSGDQHWSRGRAGPTHPRDHCDSARLSAALWRRLPRLQAEQVAETDLEGVVDLARAEELRARAHEQPDTADQQAPRLQLAEERTRVALEVDERVEIQLQPGVAGTEGDCPNTRDQLVHVGARRI